MKISLVGNLRDEKKKRYKNDDGEGPMQSRDDDMAIYRRRRVASFERCDII